MPNKFKNPQTPILFDDVEKGSKCLRQSDNEVYGRSSAVIFQVVTDGEISMKYFYEYKVSEITIEYPTKCLD